MNGLSTKSTLEYLDQHGAKKVKVIMEVRSAEGGNDAKDLVNVMTRAYLRHAERALL